MELNPNGAQLLLRIGYVIFATPYIVGKQLQHPLLCVGNVYNKVSGCFLGYIEDDEDDEELSEYL